MHKEKTKKSQIDWPITLIPFGLILLLAFFLFLDRLRSSVKLSCNQLFLDVFKVVDHTLPGLVSTAD